MTTNSYGFVAMYDRALDTAAHLLTKGANFAAEQGVAEPDMLGWRLIDGMHPLSFQLGVVINFSQSWLARAVGQPVPDAIDPATLDVAGFQAAIAAAKARLAVLTPAQFAGRDETPLTVKLGDVMEPTLPAARWLSVFATTNVYFHMSMVYAILRAKGVTIGKIDLFPGGL